MFNLFRKKSFEQKVRQTIKREFQKYPGGDIGKTLFHVFEAIYERAQGEADLPRNFMAQLEASSMSERAGAIALLDASITGAKKLLAAGLTPSDFKSTIFVMEQALDRMFLAHPTEVFPRNGAVGSQLGEFTKDWNSEGVL